MAFNWEMLKELLIVAISCSAITVAFIQKTKKFCKNSRWVTGYSFVVNMVFGLIFSKTFSSLNTIQGLWVGFFSFIGADTVYRNLEGKLTTYTELRNGQKETSQLVASGSFIESSKENDILGEIPRD